VLVSDKGLIRSANLQALTLFGYTHDELIDQPIEILIPTKFHGEHRGHRAKYGENPTPRLMRNRNVDLYGVRKDDEKVPVEVNLTPITVEEKTFVIATIRDVTDYKKAQKALLKKTTELERTNAELEQFVYIASHDLREPLIGVAGYASLLQRRIGDKLDEQETRWLSQILEGTKAMEQKLDDMLLLSRAGRNLPNGHGFPLGAAVDEARRNLAASLTKTEATIDVEHLPLVKGDRSMIAQVFQNLFSNSIKYRGDQPPKIEVKAKTENNEVTVSVKDYGIGFDMRHAERIFKVFQRLYTIEEYPGTGIGLAIVKKIVERHKGRIWVESTPDKGATFYFTLTPAETP